MDKTVSNLEEANKNTDMQPIKNRMDELNKLMMDVSQKMYKDSQPRQEETHSSPEVEDAEFEEVT